MSAAEEGNEDGFVGEEVEVKPVPFEVVVDLVDRLEVKEVEWFSPDLLDPCL